MLLIAAALVVAPISHASQSQTASACKWIHGRFIVSNGSSVRRIWVIGTHRLVALLDSDESIPDAVQRYADSGRYVGKEDGLFGDFKVCALEHTRAGYMQHVRMTAARHLTFRGKRFSPPACTSAPRCLRRSTG